MMIFQQPQLFGLAEAGSKILEETTMRLYSFAFVFLICSWSTVSAQSNNPPAASRQAVRQSICEKIPDPPISPGLSPSTPPATSSTEEFLAGENKQLDQMRNQLWFLSQQLAVLEQLVCSSSENLKGIRVDLDEMSRRPVSASGK